MALIYIHKVILTCLGGLFSGHGVLYIVCLVCKLRIIQNECMYDVGCVGSVWRAWSNAHMTCCRVSLTAVDTHDVLCLLPILKPRHIIRNLVVVAWYFLNLAKW